MLHEEQTCEGVTIDIRTCKLPADSLITQTRVFRNDSACQFFCTKFFKEDCKWFEYNRVARKCKVHRSSFKDYINSCRKVGGPPVSTVEGVCDVPKPGSNDPCMVLTSSV